MGEIGFGVYELRHFFDCREPCS